MMEYLYIYSYVQVENYDGLSGVYLGPSRTLDKYDLEYLNGDIKEENDEIADSYRQPNLRIPKKYTVLKIYNTSFTLESTQMDTFRNIL